jgi:hypothetical protein
MTGMPPALHATAPAQESRVRPGRGDPRLIGVGVGSVGATAESRVLSSQWFGVVSSVLATRAGVPWS